MPLAPRPGTAVEPKCSIRRASGEGLAQRGVDLLEARGPRGVVVLDDDVALLRPADEHRIVHWRAVSSVRAPQGKGDSSSRSRRAVALPEPGSISTRSTASGAKLGVVS